MLMEGAPGHVDVGEVRSGIRGVAGVYAVHDLHTSGMVALSAHVVSSGEREAHELLGAIQEVLHDRFEVGHVTVQIEPKGFEERDLSV